MDQNTGKLIIYIAVLLLIVGIAIYFFHDKLNWLGKLPGDIRIERENIRFYFPVTTMILLSLVLTLIVNIVRKFL